MCFSRFAVLCNRYTRSNLMDQSGNHIGNVRNLLHKVLDDWLLAERKAIRTRLSDYDDRLEKLEFGSSQQDAGKAKIRLVEQRDRFKDRIEARYAMFDEAHRQMKDYVEGRERDVA